MESVLSLAFRTEQFYNLSVVKPNQTNQSKLKANSCSRQEAREKLLASVTIGFGFSSDRPACLHFIGTEYDTVKELIEALKAERTDAVLLDMYVIMKRKDVFNDTSAFKVVEIIEKEIAHGIELKGVTVALAKRIEDFIRENNVQTEFLEDKSHEVESEEEHEEHEVCK